MIEATRSVTGERRAADAAPATLDPERARRFADLESKLADDADLDDLLRLLDLPWQRELLYRAALPLRFDRAAAMKVLVVGLPDGPAPAEAVEWLLAHRDVERRDASGEVFAVRQGARREHAGVPHAHAGARLDVTHLFGLAAALAGEFHERGNEWELDALVMLAYHEPRMALRRAEALFNREVRRADFTGCFRILQLLEAEIDQFEALATWRTIQGRDFHELTQVIAELRRRFDAAQRFTVDYERTTQVLERQEMTQAWRWLSVRGARSPGARTGSFAVKGQRASRAKWILNIEARGGAGKTMFLRWLSARKCLPNGVPYARLDFDFVDPRLTKVAPWYLLAQCARTLDAQLPGRPLRAIVARADDVVSYSAFALGPAESARALRRLESEIADELAREIISDLARAITAAKAPSVVIVLDTLEVALLHQQADVMALLSALQELHGQCSKVKVILSGRFDLGRKLPGFDEKLGSATRTLLLTAMSDEESTRYLVRKRGMKNGPVVREIVRKAKGLPFALSLFADEWQIKPTITAAEVRAIDGPELHHLVHRVLMRVPPLIAWLLRYGVVARQLTKDFVAHVVIPELECMRDGKGMDDPQKDSPVVRDFFELARLEEVSPAELLWAELEHHASTFSFVSWDPTRPDCLVIHPDVAQPLQKELKKQRVMRRLHRRAKDLAELRAGTLSPEREQEWGVERSEALYHALRLSPSMASRSWRVSNEAALRMEAHEARRTVAAELLNADDIPRALRLEAARVRTEACIAIGLRQPKGSDWAEAGAAHKEWRALLRQQKRVGDAAFHIAGVRIASRSGLPQGSGLRTLERLIPAARNDGDRLALHAALVEGYAGQPKALAHIKRALAILSRARHGWTATRMVRFKLAATLELSRQGRYDEALAMQNEVVAERRVLSSIESLHALGRQLRLQTTCGQPELGRNVVKRIPVLERALVERGDAATSGEYEALLALREDAMRAQRYGGAAVTHSNRPGDQWVPSRLNRLELDQQAQAEMELMNPSLVVFLFQNARTAAGRDNVDVTARTLLHNAEFTAFQLGDLRQARELVQEAATLTLPVGSIQWWDVNLAICALLERQAPTALARMQAHEHSLPSAWGGVALGLAELAVHAHSRSPNARVLVTSRSVARAMMHIQPLAARRRLVAELLSRLMRPKLHPSALPAIRRALQVKALARSQRRESAIDRTIERWLLVEWSGQQPLPSPGAWRASDCVNLAWWRCRTAPASGRIDVDDALLSQSDASEFARGIAHLACAESYAKVRERERARVFAERASTLLAGETIPHNIWLVRANRLCALVSPDTTEHGRLWLAVEEMSDRLDAIDELTDARAFLRMLGDQPDGAVAQTSVVNVTINPRTIPIGGGTPISYAARADAQRATTRRLPENVVAQLQRDYSGAVRDLTQLLPKVSISDAAMRSANVATPKVDLRLAIVASDPCVAALPFEVTVAQMSNSAAGRRSNVRQLPGWRALETPRAEANERWARRVFDSIGVVPTPKQDGSIAALVQAFQEAQGLTVTGSLDAATLRRMSRVARGDRDPQVAILFAMSPSLASPDGVIISRALVYGRAVAERMYAGMPALVTSFAGLPRALLARHVQQPFDLIHIVAPVVESSSHGGLAFDLGSGARSSSDTPDAPRGEMPSGGSEPDRFLSLSELSGAIKHATGVLRPIVVVHNSLEDLPIDETVRQYALRNVMAMELFRSGGTVATVAVSGGGMGTVDAGIPLLPETMLRDGEPLVAFLDRLGRRTDRDGKPVVPRSSVRDAEGLAEQLQLHATCVFAANPEFIYL